MNQPIIENASAPRNMLNRSPWQRMMVACAVIIAFDPFKLFEQQLLQQVPIALVIGYLMFSVLHRPLAPLRSPAAMIFLLMFLWGLPGVIHNKLSQDTGMFTLIMMFLIPISAAYAVSRHTMVDGRAMLTHAQLIGIAFFLGSLWRLASDPQHQAFWYGIHERSFLLPLLFVPPLLLGSYRNFALTFACACILLFLDFRATTAFCLVNSLVIAIHHRWNVPRLFVYFYIIAFTCFLITQYIGFDIVWDLYSLVKGVYSHNINDAARQAMLVLALDEWAKAPYFGDFFSGQGAYDIRPYLRWWPGESDLVPLHNDFLDFLVRGGIVGLMMFLTGLGSVLMIALRNMESTKRQGREDLSIWNMLLLTTLINIMFVISFNPVLKTVSHGFVAQLVLAWIISLHIIVKNGDSVGRIAPAGAAQRVAYVRFWVR